MDKNGKTIRGYWHLPCAPLDRDYGSRSVSLLELLMTLGTHAHEFGEVMRRLADCENLMLTAQNFWADPGNVQAVVHYLNRIRTSCGTLGMVGIIKHIDRTIVAAGKAPTSTACASLAKKYVDEVLTRLEDDLVEHKFLYVQPSKLPYYMNQSLFGDPVNAKFSSVRGDIEEAGTCFAVGRNTAVVFHLMRVMEAGLRALAKELKAKFSPDGPWGEILRNMKEPIENMPHKTRGQKKRKADFSAAHAHLDSVKLAWRNDVMHPKESYKEEEAQQLLYNVRSFMQHLTEILK